MSHPADMNQSDQPPPETDPAADEEQQSAPTSLPEMHDPAAETAADDTTETASADVSDLEENITRLSTQMDQLAASMAGLRDDFQSKIQFDSDKQETIRLLHEELNEYRGNLVLQHMRSMALQLSQLHADMTRILGRYDEAVASDNTGDSLAQKLFNEMEGIQWDIKEILSLNGFELYQEESETFQRTQRPVRTEPTDDPQKKDHIAERVRPGLRYDDHVVQPEEVVVYRYVAPPADETEPAHDDPPGDSEV